jgi:DNA-binding HxlR family transcriptional regulator
MAMVMVFHPLQLMGSPLYNEHKLIVSTHMKVSTSDGPPAETPGSLPLSQQIQRGDLLAAACPSREVLKHVTSRWGVLVLMVLETRKHRFSELRRAIGGVSERMLAQTLQWLEGDGLVERVAFQVVPPHVEYSLTPLGREAAGKVRGLADWIEINLPRILAARK